MGYRVIAAGCITASLLLAGTVASSLAQSQLPRPGQLPPAGGQQGGQQQQQQQRPQAAPPQQQQQQQGQQRPPQEQPPQQQAAPPKPYTPVAITAPPMVNDPSFEAFRKKMGAAAEKKDRKAIADMVSKTFFWMGEKGDRADKKRPGIENLAKAIGLDAKDGSGWEVLQSFAADPTGMPFPERKDTICGPAEPQFDFKQLETLAKATGTEEGDWAYPTQPGLEMRAAAQPNAAVVEKLGMHFIRVMEDGTEPSSDNPMIKVVAPSGKVGFVPGDAISPLGHDAICYAKEGGGWKIAGFLGGAQ
ncbi:MAG TPA: hypothetical protein VIU42_01500 [Xanthobacteraceae bacterium]